MEQILRCCLGRVVFFAIHIHHPQIMLGPETSKVPVCVKAGLLLLVRVSIVVSHLRYSISFPAIYKGNALPEGRCALPFRASGASSRSRCKRSASGAAGLSPMFVLQLGLLEPLDGTGGVLGSVAPFLNEPAVAVLLDIGKMVALVIVVVEWVSRVNAVVNLAGRRHKGIVQLGARRYG